ncbi:MAG: hypothetical protein K1Y02_20130 [Candidatus Hydrogenedentes bacterium]|nr:hypothetical protein [Candidatus Hydrogenedentota bacterium]
MSSLQGGISTLFLFTCVLFVGGVAISLLRWRLYSLAFERLSCEMGLTPAHESRCEFKSRLSPFWRAHYGARISLYDQFLVLTGYGASFFGGPWVIPYGDVTSTTVRRGIIGDIVTVSFVKESRTIDMDLRVFGNLRLKQLIDFMVVAARKDAERGSEGSIAH